MWISQQNEDSQGATNHQSKKNEGKSQTYDGLGLREGFSFPKSLRILSRKYFKRLSSNGVRFQGDFIAFQHYQGKHQTRLGITVSKKYGKAHDRNRFKRLVREVFREFFSSIPSGIQMNVIPKLPRTALSKAQVLEDFISWTSSLVKKE